MKRTVLSLALLLAFAAHAGNDVDGNCGVGSGAGNAQCGSANNGGAGGAGGQGGSGGAVNSSGNSASISGGGSASANGGAASSTSAGGTSNATGGNAAGGTGGSSVAQGGTVGNTSASVGNVGGGNVGNTSATVGNLTTGASTATTGAVTNTNSTGAATASVGNTTSAVGNTSATTGPQTQSTDNANNASQSVTVNGDTYQAARIPVASAWAPAVNPTAVCALGMSGGVQGVSLGVSFGGTYIDKNCELLEQVRAANNIGEREVAREMLCDVAGYRNARARMGKPCAADATKASSAPVAVKVGTMTATGQVTQ